jgi:hypothetical protein
MAGTSPAMTMEREARSELTRLFLGRSLAVVGVVVGTARTVVATIGVVAAIGVVTPVMVLVALGLLAAHFIVATALVGVPIVIAVVAVQEPPCLAHEVVAVSARWRPERQKRHGRQQTRGKMPELLACAIPPVARGATPTASQEFSGNGWDAPRVSSSDEGRHQCDIIRETNLPALAPRQIR